MGARRGRGEGSITKRADGRWMAQADLGWQGGKRHRKTLYGRTKRAVQDKLRKTLQRIEQGLPPLPEKETVGAFLRRWLVFKKSGVRPRTYESYEQAVRLHLLPGLSVAYDSSSSRRTTWRRGSRLSKRRGPAPARSRTRIRCCVRR